MIKTISILSLAALLGGCAVYADAPYTTSYSNGIYNNGYSTSGVIVTSPPVIVNSPRYYPRPYYYNNYPRHHPNYVRPGYVPPHFNRPGYPPQHFNIPGNRPPHIGNQVNRPHNPHRRD